MYGKEYIDWLDYRGQPHSRVFLYQDYRMLLALADASEWHKRRAAIAELNASVSGHIE